MSKSTPISQLPNIGYENTSNEVIDDDATVQEVLNQFNATTNPNTDYNIPMNPSIMQQQLPPQQMFYNQQSLNDVITPPPMQHQSNHGQKTNTINKFIDGDVRTILLVVFVCILCQIIPVESYVFKYVSIEKIPYSDIICKALFAGIIFYLINKYIS